LDKLDGRIDAAFFDRMAAQWRDEQARCLRDIERHQNANRSYLEEGGHLLALAQSARRLFDRQEAREKRRLLDFVASNCSWKGGELAVIYTNPLTFLRKRRPLEHDRNYLSRWGFRRGVKADSSCWLGWRNAKALLV